MGRVRACSPEVQVRCLSQASSIMDIIMRMDNNVKEFEFYCPACDGTVELMVNYNDRNHQDCPYCDRSLIWIEDKRIH